MLLVVAILTIGPASAADAGEAGVPPAMRFFNRDIVTFRATYFGIPPAGRATQGVQRIRHVLAKDGPGSVKMFQTAEGLNVTIDGAYVFRILEGDLDAEDGQTFDQARVVVGKRLEEAAAAARESLRGRELARAIGFGSAATLGLCLVVWVLARARLRMGRWVDSRLARRLHLGQEEHAAILRLFRPLGGVAFVTAIAVLVEEWLRFVFGQFPFTRP
ncbi:MAG TPA: hypothetical protein VLT62_16865 [Candidatus Methylomirabilis sp.]|nr:hypothetical protein [Candidatus Methylomirabilis sp.]